MEKSTPVEFTLSPSASPEPALLPTLTLDRATTTELASDFTLPDYLPEIKRLLRVSAAVLPESRYLGGSSAEFGGAVEYGVLYSGGDGGLWSTRLRQDYNLSLPLDADLIAAGLDPAADTQADAVVSRVTAPRKLNIRTRLRSRVRGWSDEEITPEIEGNPAQSSLESLRKASRSMYTVRAASEPIDLSDEVASGSSGAEGGNEPRIVSAEGCVVVNEVSAADEGINCRGELVIRLLICEEGEPEASAAVKPELRIRRVSFDETIPAPGVTGDMSCRAWGRCGDLAVSVEEGRILCDATVWLEAEAAGERELALTADVYATDGETEECVYRDVELNRLSRCANGNFTLSGSVSAKEAGIDPGAELIDVIGTAQIDGMEFERGRCVMSGGGRFSVIYLAGGEYGVAEVSLPLRYEVECDRGEGAIAPTEREAELSVTQARARFEGDGDTRKLSIDAEVAAALRLSARNRQQVLAHAVYHPTETEKTAECVVCYPDPDDSLWSLAKRYRISRAAIERENQLRFGDDCDLPSSLDGVQYLLI